MEDSLSQAGMLMLKLVQHSSEERIGEKPFSPAELPGDLDVAVSGHSHSPLFTETNMALAQMLMRFSAIDGESLLRMVNPPRLELLIQRWRAIQQKQKAQGQAPQATKGEQEAKRSHKGEQK